MIALAGLEFARAGALWLAPVAVMAGLLFVRAASLSRRQAALVHCDASAVQRRSFAIARALCATCALLSAIVALAGPVVGSSERPVLRRGIDLVLCIDTSRSMLARDVRPSRFERAKREVLLLLSELQGDRISIVAFGGDARSVAPLTRDREALRYLLDTLAMEDTRVGGTNLASAIDYALGLFEERSGKHEAIVLLTDGEDLSGAGLEAAQRARERGIRVDVVGVGTVRGAKIPIRDSNGQESFLRDPQGEEVVSRLGEESLERLAVATGGAYTSTERSPRPLVDLVRGPIQDVERQELAEGLGRVPHDRYQWPLLGALLLLTIERLLSAAARGLSKVS